MASLQRRLLLLLQHSPSILSVSSSSVWCGKVWITAAGPVRVDVRRHNGNDLLLCRAAAWQMKWSTFNWAEEKIGQRVGSGRVTAYNNHAHWRVLVNATTTTIIGKKSLPGREISVTPVITLSYSQIQVIVVLTRLIRVATLALDVFFRWAFLILLHISNAFKSVESHSKIQLNLISEFEYI